MSSTGFVNGKLDGEVVIHYADGTRFRGTFRNGLREGKAIEEDAKGVRFEGSYHEDERDGSLWSATNWCHHGAGPL